MCLKDPLTWYRMTKWNPNTNPYPNPTLDFDPTQTLTHIPPYTLTKDMVKLSPKKRGNGPRR